MKPNSKLSLVEKGIAKEEKKLEAELNKEGKGLLWFFRSDTFKIILLIVVFILLIGIIIYFTENSGKISIDKSVISAPIISLGPVSPGVLDKVFVKEGDLISADTIVAQVNGQSIKSKILGLVIAVQNTPGQIVTSQTPVVEMIDPSELRLIGSIEENKGLDKIQLGQRVTFTVDAFGSRQYTGFVESIAPTSKQSDIVFSISDKRQEQEFNIKVKFDTDYPELKNGMSAKMQIST